MTSIEWLQEQILEHIEWKAPTEKRVIMKKIEQAKEMHHKELMGSMQRGMELQEKENSRIGFRERNGLLPQQEISDEEIEKFADEELGTIRTDFDFGVIQGMKWYREQLKQKK